MDQTPRIIPQVTSLVRKEGYFDLRPDAELTFRGEAAYGPISALRRALAPATGFALPLRPARSDAEAILVSVSEEELGRCGAEGYQLEITSDQIRITAGAEAGAFYGIQTLRQLFPVALFADTAQSCLWRAPALTVFDRPRFPWRGIMLDEGRHWYGKEYVRKFIDLLAMHKYNVLHWHLTENAGWRLEIERYPRLQSVAAWRDRTVIGHPHRQTPPYRYQEQVYGGYYTQDEIRELVAYAAQNHITVIPEIDMPAHSQAALAAYPELGCTGGPYDVMDIWDYSYHNFCAGNEATFRFLEGVLDEVCELFPSELIHIGGDECKKDEWKACPRCQARIREEGLKDEKELQNYFIRRVADYLQEKGRGIVGWDEIAEGGAIPGATVMLWRQKESHCEEIIAAGNPVVASFNEHTYFDYYQGDRKSEPLAIGGYLPLSKVYRFDPVPAGSAPEVHRGVRGVQGQIWSQYLPTVEQLEYMTFPRAAALAESAWTDPTRKSYESFWGGMDDYLARLRFLSVNYRKPEHKNEEWNPETAKPRP